MSKRKYKNNHRKKGLLLPFIKLHRWIGLCSFILLVVLAVTGVLLNHTEELSLDERYVNNPWLQTWYGMEMPEQKNLLKVENKTIAQLGKQIYFNQSRLPDEESPLLGGYKSESLFILGFRNAIYLLTHDGELIEKLDNTKGLPVPISQMGLQQLNHQLILASDNRFFSSNDDFISWSEIEHREFEPFKINQFDDENKALYRNIYLGNELTLERVMLDLHSGRLLGSLGVYLMDLSALMLIILGISGLWIWSRRSKKRFINKNRIK